MSVIIMDPCNYTKAGIEYYFNGKKKTGTKVYDIDDLSCLSSVFIEKKPQVVFLNEEAFIHNEEYCFEVKKMTNKYKNTLFIIFMSVDLSFMGHWLWVRNNVLITSKALPLEGLNRLLADYRDYNSPYSDELKFPVFSLSCSECCVLQMWAAGCSTEQISRMMNIKIKTVFSHKSNINIKIKATNKHTMFHIIRIINSITSGVSVKGCPALSSFHPRRSLEESK
jgi:LuxR family capsular biosynthesis transcriptional activator